MYFNSGVLHGHFKSTLNHWTVSSGNARIEDEVVKDKEKVNRISSSAKHGKQN